MTLLFHVDESRDATHHYHVGVLSDGPATAAVEKDMRELVERNFVNGVCAWEAELHAVEIFHGNGAWTKGTIAQRIEVFERTLSLLTEHGVEVIARGVHLPSFHERYGVASDPFVWEFSNLLERLNERLTARADYGLVIADEQSEHKATLRRGLAEAKRHGTGGYRSQVLERVLDTAHFVDSKESRMTQLADMVDFVLRRRLTNRPENDPRLEDVMDRLADMIYPAIPSPQGQYHTVRR